MQDKIAITLEQEIGVKVSEIKLFGKGMCNYVYLVTLVNGNQLIIKQERKDKETEEQNNIIIEAKIIKYLKNKIKSLQIPNIRFYNDHLGLYCYDFISGNTMKNEWLYMSEEERVSLCKNLGKFHARFHNSCQAEEVKNLGLIMNQSSEMEANLLIHLEHLLKNKKLPNNLSYLLEKAIKVFNTTKNEAIFRLIHNDIHHENILVEKSNISAIIDFGDTEFGDIRKEFHRYLLDYPKYFDYILAEYQNNVSFKVSKDRILSYTILLLAWKIDYKLINSLKNQNLFKLITKISKNMIFKT